MTVKIFSLSGIAGKRKKRLPVCASGLESIERNVEERIPAE